MSWLREELVLALALDVEKGVNAPQAEVAALSSTLRALPIEQHLAEDPKFRSPGAVRRKLGNLLAVATDGQKGFANYGRLDKAVFQEYVNVRDELFAAAEEIRAIIGEVGRVGERDRLFIDAALESGELDDAEEGRLRSRLHMTRERNRALTERKKARVLAENGTLACEVCLLDFAVAYGPRGEGFIECHHLRPVSELAPGQRTTQRDLALLCSNCHRMVHRKRPWSTLDELREARAAASTRGGLAA